MIKCPKCNKEIKINYGEDIDATIWNFNGVSAEIEMYTYCENCKESILILVPAIIQLKEDEIKILDF